MRDTLQGRQIVHTAFRSLFSIRNDQNAILCEEGWGQRIIHQSLTGNFLEFLNRKFFKDPIAPEDLLPDWARFFQEKIVFTDEAKDVRCLLRLILFELGKSHFECITDATSDEAKRRESRSNAAGSSGTNSADVWDSSNTSRKVQRSFWNTTLPVFVSVRCTLKSTIMVYAEPRPCWLKITGTAL